MTVRNLPSPLGASAESIAHRSLLKAVSGRHSR
jgi:hypothetical protein